jgi:uncharacterized protein
MELNGSTFVKQPIERVWAALNDEAVLQRCITGCEAMERVDEKEITARLAMKMGPVRARFNGKVVMSDVLPLAGYTLTFEGSGGAAGFAKGSSVVGLQTVAGGTQVNYTAHASVGGKLGQIGGRMIDAAARSMADDFFAAFANSFPITEDEQTIQSLSAHPVAVVPAAASLPVPTATAPGSAIVRTNSASTGNPWVWFAAGALSATALLLIGKYLL